MNINLIIIILVTIVADIMIFKYFRRGMILGFAVLFTFILLNLVIVSFIWDIDSPNAHRVDTIIVYIFIISIPLFVVTYFFSLLYSASNLIRKEGLSKINILSLTIACMMFIYILLLIFNNVLADNLFVTLLLDIFGFTLFYFFFLLLIFSISSLINMFYPKKTDYQYIIILGCGIFGERITPLLASRIELGIKYYQQLKVKNPNLKIIASGGQGPHESIPEGLAIARYLVKHNIPKSDIIIEDKSKNTYENVKFSKALMNNEKDRNLIVTNNFHIFRALVISRMLKMNSDGAGSKVKLYFSLNSWIREYIGVIYLNKWPYIIIYLIGIIGIITNLLYLSNNA